MRFWGNQQVFSRRERVLFWTASLIICVSSLLLTVGFEISQAERDFMQQASLVHEAISQRLGSLEAVLVSLVGLHHASDELSQAQFTAFTQELLGAYPHIGSVLFLNKIFKQDLKTFIQDMHDLGFIQFDVTELDSTGRLRPVASRPFYLPVSSIEPLGPLSARFLAPASRDGNGQQPPRPRPGCRRRRDRASCSEGWERRSPPRPSRQSWRRRW